MSNADDHRDDADAMREEYDFSRGVRGKYAARYAEGTNLVRVDDDLRYEFPDEQSVNDALRRFREIRHLTQRT